MPHSTVAAEKIQRCGSTGRSRGQIRHHATAYVSTTIADASTAGSAMTAAMLHTALVSTYATVGARLYSR